MNIDFSPIPVRSNLKNQPSSSSVPSNPQDSSALKVCQIIAKELFNKNINPAIIVAHCKELDLNNDGLIHINDLEEALSEALYPQNISRRALEKLASLLIPSNFKLDKEDEDYNDVIYSKNNDKGEMKKKLLNYRCIEYSKLLTLLEYHEETKPSKQIYQDNRQKKEVSSLIKKTSSRIPTSDLDKLIDIRDDKEEETWINPKEMLGPIGIKREISSGSVGEYLLKDASPVEVKNFRRLIFCLEEFERLSGIRCVETPDGFIVPFGPELRASISFFINDQRK